MEGFEFSDESIALHLYGMAHRQLNRKQRRHVKAYLRAHGY